MEYAYDQELFVSPERITGMCGRLMCCLAYEREAYLAELAELPKLGSHVTVGDKQGKVIGHSIFRRTVTVLTEDRDRIEVDIAEVTPLGSPKKPK
jgi:cell fate regulator YaaT (PSP1 superfamily)